MQCTPDISYLAYRRLWSHVGPYFFAHLVFANFADMVPKSPIFPQIAVNSLHPPFVGGTLSRKPHRGSLWSRWQETLYPTSQCRLVEHMLCDGQPHKLENWLPIVPQKKVHLIHCQCIYCDYKPLIRAWPVCLWLNRRYLHSPFYPDEQTVPQQIKCAWLVDIPLAECTPKLGLTHDAKCFKMQQQIYDITVTLDLSSPIDIDHNENC